MMGYLVMCVMDVYMPDKTSFFKVLKGLAKGRPSNTGRCKGIEMNRARKERIQ